LVCDPCAQAGIRSLMAAPTVFPTVASSKQVIKVSMGDDIRRMKLELPASTTSSGALVALHKAVRESFGLSEAQERCLVLKYVDDEGDLCTLLEPSMEDFVGLANGSVWRLQASLATPLPAATQAVNVATSQEAPRPAAPVDARKSSELPRPSAPAEVRAPLGARGTQIHANEQSIGTSTIAGEDPQVQVSEQPSVGARENQEEAPDAKDSAWEDEFIMNFIMFKLPLLSMFVQSNEARTMLNYLGEQKHQDLVPVCVEIAKHLDLVPEASALRPKIQAYVTGEDVQHFGDLLADLLQIWVTLKSRKDTKDAVRSMVKGIKVVMKQHCAASKGSCKGKSKGKGKCLKRMMERLVAKGLGKGSTGEAAPWGPWWPTEEDVSSAGWGCQTPSQPTEDDFFPCMFANVLGRGWASQTPLQPEAAQEWQPFSGMGMPWSKGWSGKGFGRRGW